MYLFSIRLILQGTRFTCISPETGHLFFLNLCLILLLFTFALMILQNILVGTSNAERNIYCNYVGTSRKHTYIVLTPLIPSFIQ